VNFDALLDMPRRGATTVFEIVERGLRRLARACLLAFLRNTACAMGEALYYSAQRGMSEGV
jgi:hypothetical protein